MVLCLLVRKHLADRHTRSVNRLVFQSVADHIAESKTRKSKHGVNQMSVGKIVFDVKKWSHVFWLKTFGLKTFG